MHTIDEKRVYGDRGGATDLYVASSAGVVRVRVNDDVVGEFGLVERCEARDVAAPRPSPDRTDRESGRPGRDDRPEIAVATASDVLVAVPAGGGSDSGSADPDTADGLEFEATGFGPAVAVGFDDGTLLAASPGGDVARYAETGWDSVEVDESIVVRAIDGPLVGTDRGVYRLTDGGLTHAGLADVRDVSAAGVPLAATGDGLYELGNGWMRALDGPVDAIATDPRRQSTGPGRAHAAAGSTLVSHRDGSWELTAEADDRLVGIVHGEAVYAVTEGGTLLAVDDRDGTPSATDGVRTRSIGVPDVAAITIVDG